MADTLPQITTGLVDVREAHRFDVDALDRYLQQHLDGYRGKPALHEASAVKALVGLSNLIADAGDRIASIDINPFLINPGAGVAVDALIVLNNAAAKRAAGH